MLALNCAGNGVVSVVIFGSQDIDVNDINLETVRFGFIGNEEAPIRSAPHLKDVNKDGIKDMVLQFRKHELGIPGDTLGGTIVTLTLTGQLTNGTEIQGQDDVRITPNNKKSLHKEDKGERSSSLP